MFEDLVELPSGGMGLAVVAVVGAGLLAARGGRPLLKGAIRSYLTVSETVRGWSATVVEQAQDLYEESKAELAETATTAGPSPQAAVAEA
jgi:hypothetical protein